MIMQERKILKYFISFLFLFSSHSSSLYSSSRFLQLQNTVKNIRKTTLQKSPVQKVFYSPAFIKNTVTFPQTFAQKVQLTSPNPLTPIQQCSSVIFGQDRSSHLSPLPLPLPLEDYRASIKKFGLPVIDPNKRPIFPLRRKDLKHLWYDGHFSLYNTQSNTALLTIHHLPHHHGLKNNKTETKKKRRPKFRPDYRIPFQKRIYEEDYKDKTLTYSKGHLVPQGDLSTPHSILQTFTTTNIAPQVQQSFNDGIWNQLEECIRTWRDQGKKLTIFTGVVFSDPQKATKLNKKVQIPTHFYKIIVDENSYPLQTQSFLLENRAYQQEKLENFITSISEIEKRTGFIFLNKFSPAKRNDVTKRVFPMWKGCH